MVKVRKMIYSFYDSSSFLISKYFFNNGNLYDGEWKDDRKHGQGNKSDLSNDLLMLNDLIGMFLWNDGDKYEGEFKYDKKDGQGNKSNY